MTFNAQLLQSTSARLTESGYEISLGLPWYRSLPWSCLEDIEVSINDEVWPFSALTVVVDGVQTTRDDLAGRWNSYWFLQHRIHVRLSSEQPAVKKATVIVRMALRLPNVLIGSQPALIRTESEKMLDVQGRKQ